MIPPRVAEVVLAAAYVSVASLYVAILLSVSLTRQRSRRAFSLSPMP